MTAPGPRLPRSDRTEVGPLTEEHRPRNNGVGLASAAGNEFDPGWRSEFDEKNIVAVFAILLAG